MKKIIISVLMLTSIAVLSSCNNGNVKKDVIDAVESCRCSYDSLETLYYEAGYAFGQKDAKNIIKRRFSEKPIKEEYDKLIEKSKVDANNLVAKTFAPLFKKYEFSEIREAYIEILGKTDTPEDEYVFIYGIKKYLGESLLNKWSDGYCDAVDEVEHKYLTF